MVLAHHLTDDTCAFAVLRCGSQAHITHSIRDAPVNRFEPIAHISDGAIE
jgi:hypothetical protein